MWDTNRKLDSMGQRSTIDNLVNDKADTLLRRRHRRSIETEAVQTVVVVLRGKIAAHMASIKTVKQTS